MNYLRFKNWGGRDPHRTAEDVAFAVARFFQTPQTQYSHLVFIIYTVNKTQHTKHHSTIHIAVHHFQFSKVRFQDIIPFPLFFFFSYAFECRLEFSAEKSPFYFLIIIIIIVLQWFGLV